MRLSAGFIVALCLAGSTSPALADAVIRPEHPYIEHTSAGPSVNFDIVVRNDEAGAVEIDEIGVFTIDARGQQVLERRVDGNGAAPAIETLGQRTLAPGETRLYFNPFPVLPADIAPAAMRVHIVMRVKTENAAKGAPAKTLVFDARATLREPPQLTLQLPLTGRIYVWDGHDLMAHHRRWDYYHPLLHALGFNSNAQRYSYDFVKTDDQGHMVVGDETKNENYFVWNAPVRAPADGEVVATQSAHPDDGSFNPDDTKADSNALLGNYVIVRHREGVFSAFGHLRQNSVTVKPGDRVKAGQVIAAAGKSGSAFFPHLHYQLMDGPNMSAEGVPSTFRGLVRLRGSRRSDLANGAIDSGDVVETRDH